MDIKAINTYLHWGKGILPFLLILLSCSSRPSAWQTDRIVTSDSKYDSSKLTFHAKDRINGIDLEILKTEKTSHLYLIVHSAPVPPYKKDPKSALVTFFKEGNKEIFIAHRHEGGQRLRVPDALFEKIINALEQKESLVITLEGYSTEVNATEFPKFYKEIQSNPLFTNPFHLPF